MKFNWLIGVTILFVIWILITSFGLINPVFLPPPADVFSKLYLIVESGEVFGDLWATAWRTILGFGMGCILGIIVGLGMGVYRYINETMELPVDFFRSIPATAIFPLFIAIWGLGDQVKVFIAAWATSMVVLINTIYGIRSVSVTRLKVARIRNMSQARIFFKVMIPDALPYIIAGARIGLSLAIVVEIVAEMFLGAHSGLGYRLFNATSIFEMDEAYATVFLVGLFGYALNKAVIIAEHKLVHWAGK